MVLTQRLDLNQSLQLRMSPQLQQAIALLQLSNLELMSVVAEEVEKNPLLEIEEHRALPTGVAGGGGEPLDLAALVAERLSLRDHLLRQLLGVKAPSDILAIARALVDELTADGYLSAPVFEIADRYKVPSLSVEKGLKVLQSCEPAGIAARDLGDCLALQLAERGRLTDVMRAICENLDRLADGRHDDIAAQLKIPPRSLIEAMSELRSLDPRPGQKFNQSDTTPAAPDVFIRRKGSGWFVELNTDTLPRVLVNDVYASELNAQGGDAARFVSQCRASANWLTRAMEQRADTILRSVESILRHQQAFFTDGATALRPLKMQTVAEDIGVHESTISRIANNKFVECEQGLFELRFFFSQGVSGTESGPDFAAQAVQARMRKLIDLEDPSKILSDDALVTLLRNDGVDIARRTIAKYREAMGIPSSVQRRRLKATFRA